MKSKQLLVSSSERGMTTAEYALGTIAVVAILAAVISVLTKGQFIEQISEVATKIIDWIQTFIKP